jgi:hypothetical protein
MTWLLHNPIADMHGPHWANLFEAQSGGAATLAAVDPSGTVVTSSGLAATVRAVSAASALAVTDCNVTCDAISAAFTVTLPAASMLAVGQEFTIIKIDSSGNAVTVATSSGGTINATGAWAQTSLPLVSQGNTITIWADGSS